jgi:RNA polymerase sigma-70 factor (ECF subfamily)
MSEQEKLPPGEEQELLNRLCQGDENAFSRLFFAYKDKLYNFLFAITKSEEIAQDLLQDVFFKVWQNREQAARVDNFNAYIYRIARNGAIDGLRRFSKESSILGELAYLESGASTQDPFEQLKVQETLKRINDAVNKLPEQQRKVYLLHKEKGYRQDEIATEMNLSVSTVRNHLMQALTNLRRYLLLLFFFF